MRYLAIDLGDKRTGVALGDSQTRVVTPVDTVEVDIGIQGGNALVEALARIVDAQLGERGRGPGELVIGLPLNMDGSEGPRAKHLRAFAERLARRTMRKVTFQDERLTTAAADWAMAGSGLTRGKKKELRDALAAAEILKDFLGSIPDPPAQG
ncbi:MAG: Holliday junction resolvase RuvX [Phycisphaerae bacterium]|nr:Holliday junction resolvase RuvX [Phycisphaerae bacterium]